MLDESLQRLVEAGLVCYTGNEAIYASSQRKVTVGVRLASRQYLST